jgi:crotonobetainyl-CoA:carnitine CoA-transferase CaiB-like acyl-CoA transferase
MSALHGLRIIELAEGVGGEYCGKLLADFGAEVVKVERPGAGSPTRTMAPRTADGAGGLFAYLNTNKRSVSLDATSPEDRDALQQLFASADAVIDDHAPDWLAGLGLGPGLVERSHPGLVVCSVTPFGFDAPADLQAAESLNVLHASGWGYHTPPPPDGRRPPLKGPGRFLADYDAGLEAAICLLACLFASGRSGRGEFIDVSTRDVLLSRADTVVGRMLAGELEPRVDRRAFDHKGPSAAFRCQDGFVYLFITSRAHWAGLSKLLGEPAWMQAFAPDWVEFAATDEAIARFRAGFAEWVGDKAREAVCEDAQRLGVPLVSVSSAADLQASEQFRFRGFFQALGDPTLGEVLYPTVPYKLSATPAKLERPAPRLGQDDGAIGPRPSPPSAPGRAPVASGRMARGGPLQGVRVLCNTKVWAGPYAGKILAMLGAEVIKVESHRNMDEMRVYGGSDPDNAPHYLCLNPEVLSIQLNLKDEAGLALFRDLAAASDVVLNNIKPGAMERAGLGYDDLRRVRPDIISVSLKMNGNDGPLAYQTGYAPCFAALGGMHYLVGYDGEPPMGMNMSYGDSSCGAMTAFGALVALLHRERSGQGQFVDVSAVECMAALVGDSLFEYSLAGEPPGPDANRHADMAPHGAYPCRGADSWISIAVRTELQWRSLCQVLRAPALAEDPRFATLAGRQAHGEALDAALAAQTQAHHAGPLAAMLRQAGVPAFRSQTALDLVSDPEPWRRGVFTTVANADGQLRPIVAAPWRLARNPAAIARGAPRLGEHNRYVYGEILGLSDETLSGLMARGVVD